MDNKLDYEVMLGLKLNDEMPEELRNKLKSHMDNDVAPMVKESAKKIVEEYAKEQGWEISRGESKISKAELEIDGEGNLLNGSEEDLNTVSGFFKNIGKKRGMSFGKTNLDDERIRDITKNTDLQARIKNLTSSINSSSSEEEKSRIAYEILSIKLKLSEVDFADETKDLIKSCEKDLERLEVVTKNTPKYKVVISVKQNFERTIELVKKTVEDIKRLNTMSEEEFMALDYESRGKYLAHVKKELDTCLDFLLEEKKSIKGKLLDILGKQMDLGDHINIVLGK